MKVGDNSSIGCVQLNAPEGCLLNCFGIQPIFHRNWYIEYSSLFSVSRFQSYRNNPIGSMKYYTAIRRGTENDIILKKSFDIENSDFYAIEEMLKWGTHLKPSLNLEQFMNDVERLKEYVLLQATYIRYRTNMGRGNYLISSNKELLDTLKYKFTTIKLTKYLVSENLLPKNHLIVGGRERTCYANPVIACPLIDEYDLNRVCALNNIDLSKLEIDYTKKFPLIEHQLDLYEIYQQYMDLKPPQRWYIESFEENKRIRAPFIIIHF